MFLLRKNSHKPKKPSPLRKSITIDDILAIPSAECPTDKALVTRKYYPKPKTQKEKLDLYMPPTWFPTSTPYYMSGSTATPFYGMDASARDVTVHMSGEREETFMGLMGREERSVQRGKMIMLLVPVVCCGLLLCAGVVGVFVKGVGWFFE